MGYIESGKTDGATVHLGGNRIGNEGYFIHPTIFTECQPHMKIVQEEIFGPVACILKFKTEEGMHPATYLLWRFTADNAYRGDRASEQHDVRPCSLGIHKKY